MVMRSGDENQLTEVDSAELVPGDVIEIPSEGRPGEDGCTIPCDLILLTG